MTSSAILSRALSICAPARAEGTLILLVACFSCRAGSALQWEGLAFTGEYYVEPGMRSAVCGLRAWTVTTDGSTLQNGGALIAAISEIIVTRRVKAVRDKS